MSRLFANTLPLLLVLAFAQLPAVAQEPTALAKHNRWVTSLAFALQGSPRFSNEASICSDSACFTRGSFDPWAMSRVMRMSSGLERGDGSRVPSPWRAPWDPGASTSPARYLGSTFAVNVCVAILSPRSTKVSVASTTSADSQLACHAM